jgi:dTDP-4-amino-4,6-dideoxygalactose transaminase
MTSGEGGMALTNDAALAGRLSMLRSHGVTRDPALLPDGERAANWYYEQQMLGFNYRMTDLHAALGLSQFSRVGAYVESRNALARRYDTGLQDLPLQLPTVRKENRSAFHLYVVRLDRGTSTENHRRVFDGLRHAGIGVNLHYIPVHLQPYYRGLGFSAGQFPEAEAHGQLAITLPLYPALTHRQQDDVVRALRDIL